MKELEKIALDLESINPYLLSGGAGALATGLAVSQIKRDPKKSRLADLGRKLAIALGGGLAAAGIHKAVNVAGENFQNALPESDISTEEKIVNTTTNPNTLRLLAAGGVGGGLFTQQTLADRVLLKKINPRLLGDPVTNLKEQLDNMKGPNKLNSYIDSMIAFEGNKDLTSLKGKVDALENKFKKTKSQAQQAKIQLEIDAAKNELSSKTNELVNIHKSNLRSAGFDASHYEPGNFNKVKQVINPYASRIYGRTKLGMLGKGLALGGSLFAPEAIDAGSDLFSSNPEE